MIIRTEKGYKFEEPGNKGWFFYPDEDSILFYLETIKMNFNFVMSVMEVDLGIEENLNHIHSFLEMNPNFYSDLPIHLFYHDFEISKVLQELEMDSRVDYLIERYVRYVDDQIHEILMKNEINPKRFVNLSSTPKEELEQQSLFMENHSYYFLKDMKFHDSDNSTLSALYLVRRTKG